MRGNLIQYGIVIGLAALLATTPAFAQQISGGAGGGIVVGGSNGPQVNGGAGGVSPTSGGGTGSAGAAGGVSGGGGGGGGVVAGTNVGEPGGAGGLDQFSNPAGGAGGAGGTFGLVTAPGASVPAFGASTVGQNGGNGSASVSASGGGGGGGAGGFGAFISSPPSAVPSASNLTGGTGGTGGASAAGIGGDGGGGGGGIVILNLPNSTFSTVGPITGGNGGNGGSSGTSNVLGTGTNINAQYVNVGIGGTGGYGIWVTPATNAVPTINLNAAGSGVISGGNGGNAGSAQAAAVNGGYGGAGGAGFVLNGSGTMTAGSGGTIGGGLGGAGGMVAFVAGQIGVGGGFGGNGGAGGLGLSMGGGTLTNNGTILGGAGGIGANGSNALTGGGGGDGGAGGVGVSLTGVTLTNTGSIAGGAGGTGGSAGISGNPLQSHVPVGVAGLGGVGLTGANVTVINSGSISGGLGLGGTAYALVLTGGANSVGSTGTISGGIDVAGGSFAPALSTSAIGTSLSFSGPLTFAAGTQYVVRISPSTSDSATTTGAATLTGASVSALFASGSYISKQYTILTATLGLGGSSFAGLTNSNLPSGFSDSLSYDATHTYLNLALGFVPPPGSPPSFSSFNINQQNVANALTNFFNTTGGIPMVFGTLTPAGLTQASGELATGTQQTTFDAMNLFMGLLTDPFIGGRGNNNPTSTSSATPFAQESDTSSAYASTGKSTGAERDAYGMMTKAVPRNNLYDPRWSIWAAGFGGSETTSGNAVVGSNTSTSSIYGTAVGADYLFSPRTIAGFALAGGGTNFSVANGLGSGRSDLFQAGAFVRHTAGAAYITGALAYGWQDVTTNRTVTIAGTDQLQANFNTNAFSGRLEGGYRFDTRWTGVTPYAAAQFTTYDLPAYAEQVLMGTGNFALNYAAKDVTASRTELGVRTDNSFALTNAVLTLRSRFAWAHNYDTDPSIGATFQSLPGASFVVNGAAQAHDTALTTVSAELKWRNGLSLAATFEGEFSSATTSYAGKGVIRYTW